MKKSIFIVLILNLLLIGGCVEQVPEEVIESNPYLILYAFEAEGKLLASAMTEKYSEKHLGRDVIIGKLSGQKVVLAESGVGMTNAAMTTQHMIDEFTPVAVMFSGIAGGIDSSVHIGDIVICSGWIEHDYGYIGKEGFAHMPIKVYYPQSDSIIRCREFPVDADLFASAGTLAEVEFDFHQINQRDPRVLIGGVGVTGNMFVDQIEKRFWLSEKFEALVTDMETAAVAQVCQVNEVPFIAFRSASDVAGGSGSSTADIEIEDFFQVAADNSSKVLIEFLKHR